MKKLIKLHFFYLINKKTLIILIISLLLCSLSFFSNIANSKFLTPEAEIDIYYRTSLAISKIIIAFIIITLYTFSMIKDNDFYINYLIGITRKKYLISKLLLLLLISIGIAFIIFSFFLLVGFLGNKYFYFQFSFMIGFLEILLISIINGLYGMLLMQIFKNIFVIFIPFLFVILSEDISNSFLSLLIPTNYFGIGYLLWLIIILNLFNLQYYCYRDLNF